MGKRPFIRGPRRRPTLSVSVDISRKAQRIADAAAFDAMCARASKTPPPLPKVGDTRTAGAVALAKEVRKGRY